MKKHQVFLNDIFWPFPANLVTILKDEWVKY